MDKCVQCGAQTQLYDRGVPVCLKCAGEQERKQEAVPKSKPPQSELNLTGVNARLTAARAEYRKALAFQAEVSNLRDALGPGNPDGAQALRNANSELSIASGKYEDALHDFMNYTDPHRRSG
jgi:hypothetical protein